MFSLQGAKGFYGQLLISALLFWILIRRSNTANLVRNLVYIILDSQEWTRLYLSRLSVPILTENIEKFKLFEECGRGVYARVVN